MICGENQALKALDDAKAAIQGAISGGMAALDDLQAQADAALASLSDIKIELPDLPDLQGELAKLQDMITNPLDFSAQLAAIKDQFGDAIDDFDQMIADLGLDNFPPDLTKMLSGLCDVPNKQVDQDGNVVEKPAAPKEATAFPANMPAFPEIKQVAVTTPAPNTTADQTANYGLTEEELAAEAPTLATEGEVNVTAAAEYLFDAMAISADQYPSNAFMPVKYYYWGFLAGTWFDLPGHILFRSHKGIPSDGPGLEGRGEDDVPEEYKEQFQLGVSWGHAYIRTYNELRNASQADGVIPTFTEAVQLYNEGKF